VFRIRSGEVCLKTWVSAALVSVEEADSQRIADKKSVSYLLVFKERRHEKLATSL
jgi:hypothetical protein